MFGPCWPFAWWHRRLRKSDTAVMWPEIVRAAYARYTGDADVEVRIQSAWRAFTAQRGQEHWHCPCAHEDDLPPGGTHVRS